MYCILEIHPPDFKQKAVICVGYRELLLIGTLKDKTVN
jgi:hypothetical protein